MCFQIVAPISAGVGIADLAPVAAAAPTSLAYSGSTAAPVPAVGWVAICQKTTMPAKISSDSSAALKPSEFLNAVIVSAPLDGEACDVVGSGLELPPALHLAQDPDRELVPREGIEVDAVGIALHAAQPVGIGAGQDLLEHRLGLVQVVLR